MSAMLTADWFPLGKDVYFRKFEIYSLNFFNECSSENLLVAAPYGGSIAVTKNPKKLVKIKGSAKTIISLYSSSGNLTAKIHWTSGQLIAMGWSHQEDLLCIQEDGMVLMYDMFGTYQHTFSMGDEAKETKVAEAKFFPSLDSTGVAILTSAHRIFLVNNVSEPKVRKISDLPKFGGTMDSWCIVRQERDSVVIMANQEGIHQLHHSYSPISTPYHKLFNNKVNTVTAMSVSGNSRHIALYANTGFLYLGSADLKEKYHEFNTNIKDTVTEIAWCGSEAVVCCWDKTMMIIGCSKDGDTIAYSYDGLIRLITEIDCVRVLTATSHELIQKVPKVVQKIFRINSTDPASYLLEASKQFEKESHKADSYIDLIKDKLEVAVTDCINAASHEFDFHTQKLLMKAAQYGKGFSKNFNSDQFVDMCRTLRVLNAVRHPKIGIPLTYIQLNKLTYQVMLDRLVARRHYYLAIQIAKHLKLSEIDGESRILAHWACYKVKQTQLDKEQIAEEIADKLGYTPGVSYSEIAVRAADYGRKQLAIKLIDYEPNAHLQVPLLLRLGEERTALKKAVESGNTDLVYTVILHLREHKPLSDFQMSIMHCPLAMTLYIKYCRNHNRETLRDIYNQYDDYYSQALWFVRESYQDSTSRDAMLKSAYDNFKLAKCDTNASLTDEQIKLLRYQRSLEETLHESVVGKSLHDTIKMLLMNNEIKLADKLKSEYKVHDRRYWWLRIQCLADQNSWMELERFSKVKKSPIGYEPFIDQCLKYKKDMEAMKYLPRVRDDLKVKYFVKLNMFLEAAQVAVEQKDPNAMDFVMANCKNADKSLQDRISAMMISLRNNTR
ncbi:vacuolar protein sorting-associated protein 16 homolog [Trichogramma pretiosum]|uniref:vacuolar protein sorting-associated protein 16 homolog n=1 Tax=Trichogramma pretiosum TaxID=7493 RepID=UPI0006C98774|nr:vacuolar protein sorting-associated protein 16 homolog [Trichogramma pretiosum]